MGSQSQGGIGGQRGGTRSESLPFSLISSLLLCFLGHGTVVSARVVSEGIGLDLIVSPIWSDASNSAQPFSKIDGVYLRGVGSSGP